MSKDLLMAIDEAAKRQSGLPQSVIVKSYIEDVENLLKSGQSEQDIIERLKNL